MNGLTGGCLCGAVRYRLASAPFDAGWCHCRTCQLNSGSPAMAFASVRMGDWVVSAGEDRVVRVRSSDIAQRLFCAGCGTPLAIDYDVQPETFDFSLCTLDDPGAIAPGFHIFWGSRVAWFNPGDDLPKHDRFRPGTVGLNGIEPPG
ncbi:GFA family protein [Sphingomonas sinipercae]|uniref:GFA family protein n=1 Tax=Sphingomonas sinipercae TaxID=2714944 RepID=A0A6G7ZNS8_9SPHN|nr:GFA family protein [Sphingomonas sinipercae]QIL02631.1 GFA family protein [Sphingomonas sinipercae]